MPQPDPVAPRIRAFLKRVTDFAVRHSLWKKGDAFIVGVSGGADSLCLLDVLSRLSKKYAFTLTVAHVNYRLRGNDSDADEIRVREAAGRYGWPVRVLRPRVAAQAGEEALRDIRFSFFRKLQAASGSTAIVLAHHEDDQAETLLLRLLRGAGLQGLSAMRPREGSVIRPLLSVPRTAIRAYVAALGIPYGEDSTNTDPRFLRNRVRHELIPFLEERFQPNIRERLARTAGLLAEDYALLEAACPRLSVIRAGKRISFSRTEALELPLPALRLALRSLLAPLLGGKNPQQATLDEIAKVLRSGKKKAQKMAFQGLKLECRGDTVTITKSITST